MTLLSGYPPDQRMFAPPAHSVFRRVWDLPWETAVWAPSGGCGYMGPGRGVGLCTLNLKRQILSFGNECSLTSTRTSGYWNYVFHAIKHMSYFRHKESHSGSTVESESRIFPCYQRQLEICGLITPTAAHHRRSISGFGCNFFLWFSNACF